MTLTFTPIDGIGEITPGDDIAEIIAGLTRLADGDVVVVTSKVVSKAAGLATTRDKDELLAEATDRVVARRGETQIVRTHHGLTMAAAGIDASNTTPGTLIPLPPDPDASAQQIRSRLRELTGATVAVIVSDTAGRAWRVGQTDMAIGCAGLTPVESFAGRTDPYGNPLAVTAPAVADEIAGAAEIASGKFGARPVVLVRGVDPDLLTDDDGPGAAALIREESGDMFGLGAREAVVAAVTLPVPARGLPVVDVSLDDLVALARPDGVTAFTEHGHVVVLTDDDPTSLLATGAYSQRVVTLGRAHGIDVSVVVRGRSQG